MSSPEQAQPITIWVMSDDPGEKERLDESLQQLAAELREANGVVRVQRVTKEPPPGTRVGAVIADGAMVILLYAYGVRPVASIIRDWLRRHDKKKVSIEEHEDGRFQAAIVGYDDKTSLQLAERIMIRTEPRRAQENNGADDARE
ncbi:hypothetical protein [Microbispora corallina]|nr:hypothetical protein [Microbispora corallina]